MMNLDIVGLIIMSASAIASGVNEGIRSSGGTPSKGMAIFQAVINIFALNWDKTKQAIGHIK